MKNKNLQYNFDDFAEYFDEFLFDYKQIQNEEIESLKNLFDFKKEQEILDCACGTGLQILGLVKNKNFKICLT